MDNYQAIYDAVRSRFANCDPSAIIRDAILQTFTFDSALFQQEYCIVATEIQRPSVLFRPALSVDGDQWCALYGADLQDGIAGFGETPDKAMRDFDKHWATINSTRRTA